jgi:hypothetical protein
VAVLVLIPGPAVILVMQKAVTTGYRGALRVAGGVLAWKRDARGTPVAQGGRPKRRYAVPDTGRRENVTRPPTGPAGAGR